MWSVSNFRYRPKSCKDEKLKIILCANVGVHNTIKAAAKIMIHDQQKGGRIIIAGSEAGHRPDHELCAYSASKWAVRGLTQAAAIELLHTIFSWILMLRVSLKRKCGKLLNKVKEVSEPLPCILQQNMLGNVPRSKESDIPRRSQVLLAGLLI